MYNPNLVTKVLVIVIGAAIAFLVVLIPYLRQISAIEHKSEIKINNQFIIADVSVSEDERNQGLSGRKSLGLNDGMLFLFPKPGVYGFWMKGMKFPIDIIWISESRIAGIVENAKPQPGAKESELKIYYPPRPVDEVLEIASGRAKLLRAKVGDIVKIRPLVLGAGKSKAGL